MTAKNGPPLLFKNSLKEEISNSTKIQVDESSITSSTELWADQCELTFTKLHTGALKSGAFALENVSGVAKPGQVLSIMGESGCGKTTLLNALSSRIPLTSGHIYLNGEPLCKQVSRRRIGYVLQNDMFFPSLTLMQTLVYMAQLRLSDVKYSWKEKNQKVHDIIDQLNLEKCQNTPVGDGMAVRGLSGGEKKRLSIACELITNPSVLLIDEPTSGLDSFTAIQLITTLKDFARRTNKNVIFTVHQPSSRMFQMFDSLLAMSNGKVAYFGPAEEMTTYMSNLGITIPNNYNPADFLLETLKNDEEKVIEGWRAQSQQQCQGLICPSKYANQMQTDSSYGISPSTSLKNACAWPTSFTTQVKVLTKRHWQLALPRIFSKVNVIQTVVLGILAGLTWFQIPRKEESLKDLEGWMFFSSHYWMLFVLFQALWAFPIEKHVIDKERLNGSYRFSAYYFAKLLSEAPIEICLPSLYLLVSYPLMGGTFAAFLLLILSQMLSSLAAASIGLFLGAILEAAPAMTVAAIFTVAAQLLGGYLSTNIPTYVKILSLVYNGLRNMQIVEFVYGLPIKCASGDDPDYIVSQFKSCRGNETASENIMFIHPDDLLTRDESGFVFPLAAHTYVLVAFIVVFRILSYCASKRLP